jgi:hypothetical protein
LRGGGLKEEKKYDMIDEIKWISIFDVFALGIIDICFLSLFFYTSKV